MKTKDKIDKYLDEGPLQLPPSQKKIKAQIQDTIHDIKSGCELLADRADDLLKQVSSNDTSGIMKHFQKIQDELTSLKTLAGRAAQLTLKWEPKGKK